MKGKKTFTQDEINRIEQLFMLRDASPKSKGKNIRDKMRELNFYITDFQHTMSLEEFRSLVKNGEIVTVKSYTDRTPVSNQVEEISKPAIKEQATEDGFNKKGLAPWIDENSEFLILGTIPSSVSIEKQAYYQNKSHNSFWKLMHGIFGEGDDSKEFLLQHHIALWDCAAAANQDGNTDEGIKGERPNDIAALLKSYPGIKKIVLNGTGDTQDMFDKYNSSLRRSIKVIAVPSSSNARGMKFEDKLDAWKTIIE